jgi:hypothetical protein
MNKSRLLTLALALSCSGVVLANQPAHIGGIVAPASVPPGLVMSTSSNAPAPNATGSVTAISTGNTPTVALNAPTAAGGGGLSNSAKIAIGGTMVVLCAALCNNDNPTTTTRTR